MLKNVNDPNTNLGDAADTVGANLIAISFGIPALFRLRPVDVRCDEGEVARAIDEAVRGEDSYGGSDAVKKYLQKRSIARYFCLS